MNQELRRKRLAALWFFNTVLVTSAFLFVIFHYLKLPGGLLEYTLGALLAGMAVTGAFLMVFHYSASRTEANIFTSPRYNLPMIFLAQSLAYIAFVQEHMSLNVLFMTSIIFQAIGTFCAFKMALRGFKIKESDAKKISILAAAAVLGCGPVAWQLKNFVSLEFITIACAVSFSIINALGLLGVGIWYSWHPSYRINSKSALESFRLRLDKRNGTSFSIFQTTIMASFIQTITIVYLALSRKPLFAGDHYLGSIAFQLLFIPAIIDAWAETVFLGNNLKNLQDISRMTASSAKRFLSRHKQKSANWSAAIGLKTAFLHIEHDVENTLQNQLPATLLRIRSEETNRIVESLMGDKTILTDSSPEQISCAVDPENSVRPCLDALKLCATLYLDAGIVLQKRLQGLITLLPIVNPGLATAMNRELAIDLLGKTKWFFFFDHLWIDQRILTTPHSSQYGIQYDQLRPDARMQLITHMRNIQGLGNFIWFSQHAKERVDQELPSLTNIFQPHEMTLSNGKNILMFTVKFEEIIPRLQRYYALDQFRETIVDFEPGKDSHRLLNILSLQINNALKESDCIRVVDVITSFRWRGFKEKDLALRLLLNLSDRINKLTDTNALPIASRNAVLDRISSSISQIGYPSQIMNQAHLYKIENRNLAKIQAAALDSRHPANAEAWATLASIDYRRFTSAEFLVLKSIIKSAASRSDLLVSSSVQARVLECAVNLIKIQTHLNQPPDVDLLMEPINSIVSLRSDLETASLIIDVLIYANRLLNEPISLNDSIINYFENLVGQPANKSNYWQQSVTTSWREFKVNHGHQSRKNLKAS